jgi:hypothetical protein
MEHARFAEQLRDVELKLKLVETAAEKAGHAGEIAEF